MGEAVSIAFTVPGTPQPKGSTRIVPVHGRPVITSDNAKVKTWQATIAKAALVARRKANAQPFAGAVSLTMIYRLPRPIRPRAAAHITKPDLDKLVRLSSDALTGVLYHDDAQVIAITAVKCYADGATIPGVDIIASAEEAS